MTSRDILDVAITVGRAFDACGLNYFLGGSLASSFQGEPRATNDIDFVVDLSERDVEPLIIALGGDYEVDPDALRTAVRERRSWNIIYLPSVTKIDLFVKGESAFDTSEFTRRRPIPIRSGHLLYIKSPEDTVLRKLLWYREGGGLSDRQWRDIIGVLRFSRAELDQPYLDNWAELLGLSDLLARARVAIAANPELGS